MPLNSLSAPIGNLVSIDIDDINADEIAAFKVGKRFSWQGPVTKMSPYGNLPDVPDGYFDKWHRHAESQGFRITGT
jgi:hypothetical protein